MRKSTLILSLALITTLSYGADTTYNFYAPITSGTTGQVLISAGTNGNPIWGAPPVKYTKGTIAASCEGTVHCYRHLNVVTIVFDAMTKYTDNIITVCTIPSGYRPSSWCCASAGSTDLYVGMFNLSPNDGTVSLFGSWQTSSSTRRKWFGTITYITNDAMP